jgi:hypothetical protein
MDGWLIQVTSGNPAMGAQQVDLYAAWDSSDDDAVTLVIKSYGLTDEHVVSTVIDLSSETLAAHGLSPGQVGPYREDL